MLRSLQKFPFRRVIAIILIAILALVVLLSIPSLGFLIMEEILAPPVWIVTIDKMRSILDLVLWILITVELMETVRVYLRERDLHLETVLSASIIAMARKIIAVRLRDYEPLMVLGIAAIIAALGWSYYMIRKSRSFAGEDSQNGKSH